MAKSTTPLIRLNMWHILILAFALRSLWALWLPIDPVSDSAMYDVLAQRIADGHGYSWPDGAPAVYWAVGTPALYGGIYYLFGHSYAAVAIVNVVMGTMLIAAIYQFTCNRFGLLVARLAALLAAVWPSWIALTTIISSELPSNLLLAAGIACSSSRLGPFWLRVASSSLLLVGAAYIRPTTLPLVLAVPVLEAVIARKWRAALAATVISLAVAAVTLSPWAIRNQQIFGTPVLISANLGANLWMGNNPRSNGGYMPLPEGLPRNEVIRDRLLKQQALDYIWHNPLRYVSLCLNRIRLSFDRETIAVAWNAPALPDAVQAPLKIIMSGYWLIVLCLAIVGAVHYLWREPFRLLDPLIISSGLLASTSLLVVGMDRYHFGLMPFIASFAAYCLSSCAQRWHAARSVTT